MSRLELRIPPLVVVLVVSAFMCGVERLVPSLSFAVPGSSLATAVLALAGGLMALLGVLEFRRAGTTVDPTKPAATSDVVRTGIYGFSRNPMYLGFALVLLGLAVWLSHVLALVGVPVFVAYMDRFQIGPEERALHAKFGSRFSSYAQSVRRWI